MLPVDEPAVEAGHVFTQRLELGTLPFLMLGLDPIDRFLHEKLQGGAVHAAHIRNDVDGAANHDPPGEFDESQRPPPAYPDVIDRDPPASPGDHRQADLAVLSANKLTDDEVGWVDLAALLADQLEPHAPAVCRPRQDRRDLAA